MATILEELGGAGKRGKLVGTLSARGCSGGAGSSSGSSNGLSASSAEGEEDTVSELQMQKAGSLRSQSERDAKRGGGVGGASGALGIPGSSSKKGSASKKVRRLGE